jgi:hypothetical protein
MKFVVAFALTVGALFLSGCACTPIAPQARSSANVYHAVSRLPQTVHRVAVLPLTSDDDPSADQGRDALQPVLLSEIAKTTAFEMVAVDPGQLRAVTGRDTWSAQEVLPSDFLTRLQAATGCDAVLFCRLKQFRPYPPMAVGWDLRLVDVSSHALLWAVDEVLDSGKPAVACSARGYYEQAIHVPPPKGDPSSVLMSPRLFGQYAASVAVETIPTH